MRIRYGPAGCNIGLSMDFFLHRPGHMKLRTHLNIIVAGLTAAFVAVLIAAALLNVRASVREEIHAANRVASQLLGRLARIYSSEGGPELVLQFLQQLGRVPSNDIILRTAAGEELYRSPPPTWKAGREAPEWFAHLLAPQMARYTYPLPGGVQLIVEAQSSRAVLDAWDDLTRLFAVAAIMLSAANGLALWLIGRTLAPFPVIADGLERIQRGELASGCPSSPDPKRRRWASLSIEWRRRWKTRCTQSERRVKRRPDSKSGARWRTWSSSVWKRSGA